MEYYELMGIIVLSIACLQAWVKIEAKNGKLASNSSSSSRKRDHKK